MHSQSVINFAIQQQFEHNAKPKSLRLVVLNMLFIIIPFIEL